VILVVAGSNPVDHPIFHLLGPMEPLTVLTGYTFQNPNLLDQALTHPSLAYETQRNCPDNQRLEYLGDAVLGLILSQYLFSAFPESAEGVLTKLRARVVSRSALAGYARKIGLGAYLKMGRGEATSGGRDRDSSLADAMEALTAAVYLDGGLEAARTLVLKLCGESLIQLHAEPIEVNPKGHLQEKLQALGPGNVKYILMRQEGPDHQKLFVTKVEWNGLPLGEGEGGSKKEAETAAASNALTGETFLKLFPSAPAIKGKVF
jgi:ribonuclease-3